MMKQTITIKDMRHAIMYVNNGNDCAAKNLQDASDEQLLNYDFIRDLNMGNIRLTNVLIELQRIHNLTLPMDICKIVPNDSVKALLVTINQYIEGEAVLTNAYNVNS
jgi:hypothetical protein